VETLEADLIADGIGFDSDDLAEALQLLEDGAVPEISHRIVWRTVYRRVTQRARVMTLTLAGLTENSPGLSSLLSGRSGSALPAERGSKGARWKALPGLSCLSRYPVQEECMLHSHSAHSQYRT
jgi:hypothetical protein